MNIIFRIFLIAVCCVAALGSQAQPQTPPDYPPYNFIVQINGNPGKSTLSSDENGILTADADTYSSFSYLILHIGYDPTQLSFNYSCVFFRNNEIATSPTYDDGETCPSGGAQYVRAIRISLAGALKGKYRLQYECWIGYFGQHTLSYFGRVDEGQMCGHETGGAPTEWLSKIKVYLSRK